MSDFHRPDGVSRHGQSGEGGTDQSECQRSRHGLLSGAQAGNHSGKVSGLFRYIRSMYSLNHKSLIKLILIMKIEQVHCHPSRQLHLFEEGRHEPAGRLP